MTAPADELVGQVVGDAELVELLGEGSMGRVYRARHRVHGEVCAKVVKPTLQTDAEAVSRFRREAAASRRIDHPNVIRGYGMEEAGERLVLFQELVVGGDLEAYLGRHRGGLPLPEALRIAGELARGLHAAHEQGLVHRDLKPGNVLLSAARQVKIADFGFVLQKSGKPLDGRTALTRDDEALGTPRYMPPEQWLDSHEIDRRADIYAMGIIIHQMLTGRLPLTRGGSLSELMRAHLYDRPVPLREHLPTAPAELERLVLQMLEKRAADRPATAEAVAQALAAIASPLQRRSEEMTIPNIPPPAPEPPSALMAQAPAPAPAVADGPSFGDARVTGLESTRRFNPTPRPLERSASDPKGGAGSARGSGGSYAAVPDESEVELARADPRRRFGRYLLLSELGRGGMGVVYRAHDEKLGRVVALKVVIYDEQHAEEALVRFRREAHAAARLRHPAILSVYEYAEEQGRPFFVMEYIKGRTLGDWVREGVSLDEIVAAHAAIARALRYAHGAGVLHRDVKPHNILIGEDGRPYLMDFGLARDVAMDTVTQTGRLMGTPRYMAPEQLDESIAPVGPWADLYALGTVLYEALCGVPPFAARSSAALFKKILCDPPDPPRRHNGTISTALEAIILQCLEKDPRARQRDGDVLAEQLEAAIEIGAAPAASGSGPGGEPVQAAPARLEPPTTPEVPASAVELADGPSTELRTGFGVAGTGPAKRRSGSARRRPTTGRRHSARAVASSAEQSALGAALGGRQGPVKLAVAVLMAVAAGVAALVALGRGGGEPAAVAVRIVEPGENRLTGSASLGILGEVTSGEPREVLVGEQTVPVARDRTFRAVVRLAPGRNEVPVRAAAGAEPIATVVARLDADPPELTLLAPKPGAVVTGEVRVRGRIADDHPREVELVGHGVERILPGGAFEIVIADPAGLAEGAHALELVARDAVGNEARAPVSFVVDRTRPVVEVERPRPDRVSYTRERAVRVAGRVADASPPDAIRIGGEPVALGEGGAFSHLAPLREGENAIAIEAVDRAGHARRVVVRVVSDTRDPKIELDAVDARIYDEARRRLPIAGRLGETGCEVTVNGEPVRVEGAEFQAVFTLKDGVNRIRIRARDPAGNEAAAVLEVTFAPNPIEEAAGWWVAPPAQKGAAEKAGRPLWFEGPAGMRMVFIPAGEFLMGSLPAEEGRARGEVAHEVELTSWFYMGATEVTNEQFLAFDAAHAEEDGYRRHYYGNELDDPKQPVTQVSWQRAGEFCEWLTEKDPDWSYRLPTEAEWEYACRAGRVQTAFPWGSRPDEADRFANCYDRTGEKELGSRLSIRPFPGDDLYRVTAPVGSFEPNDWGLHDMVGNVREWCADYWAETFTAQKQVDPAGPRYGDARVVRGGSWKSTPDHARCAHRHEEGPYQSEIDLGFRVVATPKKR